MDEKFILNVLEQIPTGKEVSLEDLNIEGLTSKNLYELHQAGLLTYRFEYHHCTTADGLKMSAEVYRRNVTGTRWILDCKLQMSMAGLTDQIVRLTRTLVGLTWRLTVLTVAILILTVLSLALAYYTTYREKVNIQEHHLKALAVSIATHPNTHPSNLQTICQ